VRLLGGAGRRAVPLSSRRRARSTIPALFVVIVGAILLFVAWPSSPIGLSLHVAGVIVILIGVVWLLVPPGRLRHWVNPTGFDDPGVHDDKSAAAEVVSEIRGDEKSPPPGSQQDEL
jgi:hypothetical protein